jgi:hypothetical protein
MDDKKNSPKMGHDTKDQKRSDERSRSGDQSSHQHHGQQQPGNQQQGHQQHQGHSNQNERDQGRVRMRFEAARDLESE